MDLINIIVEVLWSLYIDGGTCSIVSLLLPSRN